MKDESQDFLVNIVNSEPQYTNTEMLVASILVLLTIVAIIWWIKSK